MRIRQCLSIAIAATILTVAAAFLYFSTSSRDAALTPDRLLASARAGGDYLVRMQKPDGTFHYLYKPAQNISARSYNNLRHAGTAYSLYQLYGVTQDVRYLDAANSAVNFLRTEFVTLEPDVLYLTDQGKGKLGGTGLALVALTYRIPHGDAADLADAQALANHILSQQNSDGSYESYLKIKGNEPRGSVSLYYPGEAILGLMKLYAIDHDERWLASAQRGAAWLIASQRAMESLPPDAWLIQALEALYAVDSQVVYLEHALALSQSIAAQQYSLDKKNQPVFALNTVQVAARAEGLISGWRMARVANHPAANEIGETLRQSAHFVLQHQYTGHEHLPDPARAAGGFPVLRRNGEPAIRIDYVQHAISFLVMFAGEMKAEPTASLQ